MKLGLALMIALGACSCSYSALSDLARARAVTDLACPSEQISVYDAIDGSTVARGCGSWTHYQCFTRVMGERHRELYWRDVCVKEASAQVTASRPSPPIPPAPAPNPEPRTPDPYQ